MKKMAGNLQPLVNNQRIVKDDGTPTDYFIRWAQQKQIDISGSITAEQALEIIQQYLADHELQAGSGIQITPSGNLSDTPTIAAEVQAILDQITNVRGSILFRGAAGWEALAPGTNGYFLKTNGAGADPAWAVGGGGGGGGWPPLLPPLAANFVANQGDANPIIFADDADVGMTFSSPSSAANIVKLVTTPIPVPTNSWTATAFVKFNYQMGFELGGGIAAFDSTTNRSLYFIHRGTGGPGLRMGRATSLTSFGTTIGDVNTFYRQDMFYRMSYDAGADQFNCSFSLDGKVFLVYSTFSNFTRTTAFPATRPDRVGFIQYRGVTGVILGSCSYWSLT